MTTLKKKIQAINKLAGMFTLSKRCHLETAKNDYKYINKWTVNKND